MSRLGSLQRSFSVGSAAPAPRKAPDADSDELDESEWPTTQRPLASRPANVTVPARAPVAGSSKAVAPAGPPKQRAWTAPKAAFASDGNNERSNAVWAQRAADRKAGGSSSKAKSPAPAPPVAVLHKRVFPWDSIEDAAEPSAKRIALDRGESGSGSRSFSALGGRSRSGSPAPGVGTSTLNIRQKVTLSSEQQKVLQLVVSGGQSVFFTGSAGTGKSVLRASVLLRLS